MPQPTMSVSPCHVLVALFPALVGLLESMPAVFMHPCPALVDLQQRVPVPLPDGSVPLPCPALVGVQQAVADATLAALSRGARLRVLVQGARVTNDASPSRTSASRRPGSARAGEVSCRTRTTCPL